MNDAATTPVAPETFTAKDAGGQDKWESFSPVVSLTVVGTPTYVGRKKVVGRICYFQISLVATTSIATTAGTSTIDLPAAAQGLGGVATMTNNTTNISVGTCHVDVATSKIYPPAQVASANTFLVAGWFEI